MATCERLQVKFERTPSGYTEDVMVVTMHFQSATATLLDNTIRAAVETRFGTLWTTWKAKCTDIIKLSEYRWYDQRVYPTPSPLLRANDITNVAGTAVATQPPPQLACSVTLQTLYRRRWGRFYMPAPTSGDWATATGRLTTAVVDALGAAAATFVQGCKTDGAYPVVWSPNGGVGPPSFVAGDVTAVTSVRVDDILDIVRSRRWQALPYRKITAIT